MADGAGSHTMTAGPLVVLVSPPHREHDHNLMPSRATTDLVEAQTTALDEALNGG
jgi:hypothetical protein